MLSLMKSLLSLRKLENLQKEKEENINRILYFKLVVAVATIFRRR